MLPKMSEYIKTCKDKGGDEKKDNKLMSLDIDDQPWESAAAFGNAVVNAVLCWFYDGKKNKKCCGKGFHMCGLSFQVLQCC